MERGSKERSNRTTGPSPPLPPELLRLIFSHLAADLERHPNSTQRAIHTFGRVCKAWRAISVERTRTEFVLRETHHATALTRLLAGQRRSDNPLKVLDAKMLIVLTSCCNPGDGSVLFDLLAVSPSLEHLDIRMASLSILGTDEDPLGVETRGIMITLASLKEFHIRTDASASLQDEHLYKLLQFWRHLRVLDVTAPQRPIDNPLWRPPSDTTFFSRCLTSLALCLAQENAPSSSLVPIVSTYLGGSHAGRLKHLHLTGIPHRHLHKDDVEAFISGLSRVGSQLESLTLHSVDGTPNESPACLLLDRILPHLTSAHTLNFDLDLFSQKEISITLSTFALNSLRYLHVHFDPRLPWYASDGDMLVKEVAGILHGVECGKVERGFNRGLAQMVVNLFSAEEEQLQERQQWPEEQEQLEAAAARAGVALSFVRVVPP
ncbi:hypothetical protein JCM6882_002037 [Rhodosporidiobolus microsporus]